jgi:hypothetical protein
MGMFSWFGDIFTKPKKIEVDLITELESKKDIERLERRNKIIADSQNHIKELNKLVDLSKDTKYHDKFKKVMELSTKIHDKLLETNTQTANLLEQFHMYYTNTFVDTYDDAMVDLKPRKSLESNLKSDFLIREDLEKKKKEEEKLARIEAKYSSYIANSQTAIDYIIKQRYKTYQVVLYQHRDGIFYCKNRRRDISYGDAFLEDFLAKQWKITNINNFVYFGDVKENKITTPVIYDKINKEIYLLMLSDNTPKKIGDYKDETILKLLKDDK